MKVLCYGSLNIDLIFSVPHFVEAGETLSSTAFSRNPGGKGANQAAALAKAGCETYMAGKIGSDGLFLVETLQRYGVDCTNVLVSDSPSGQAIIQLTPESQNAIILLPGENKNIDEKEIPLVLDSFSEGDWLVLQNEINNLEAIMKEAKARGMKICFNPAPFEDSVRFLPLELVDLLVVNEIEGAALAGVSSSFEDSIAALRSAFPEKTVIMTVGSKGSYYSGKGGIIHQPIIDAPVVDTTAAGDTFIGYYLAATIDGYSPQDALLLATKASAIAVSRKGAMQSVPRREEVFLS